MTVKENLHKLQIFLPRSMLFDGLCYAGCWNWCLVGERDVLVDGTPEDASEIVQLPADR